MCTLVRCSSGIVAIVPKIAPTSHWTWTLPPPSDEVKSIPYETRYHDFLDLHLSRLPSIVNLRLAISCYHAVASYGRSTAARVSGFCIPYFVLNICYPITHLPQRSPIVCLHLALPVRMLLTAMCQMLFQFKCQNSCPQHRFIVHSATAVKFFLMPQYCDTII